MPKVIITLNGRSYDVACEEGQEDHLHRLAEYVNKRLGELVAAIGDVGEARLLAMAAILMADEVSDAYARIEDMTSVDADAGRAAQGTTHMMDTLAERIETIADRLEQA